MPTVISDSMETTSQNPSVKEEPAAVVAPTMDFEPVELAGEMLHNCSITSFRFL